MADDSTAVQQASVRQKTNLSWAYQGSDKQPPDPFA